MQRSPVRTRRNAARFRSVAVRLPERLESRLLFSGPAAGGDSADAPADESTWRVLGGRRADAIVIDRSPDDAAAFRATVNGRVVGTRAASSLRRIEVAAGGGNDTVTIGLGAGDGSVTAHVDGGRGRDRITGGDGADELAGGDGADVLAGGGGNDRLEGGAGNDSLSGGEGADSIAGGRGRDTVLRQGGVDTTALDPRDRFGGDDNANALTRLQTDEALRQWVVESALRQYAWAFGNPAWGSRWYATGDGTVLTAAAPPGGAGGGLAAPDAATAASGSVGEGFSRTNTQAQGVDEADLVETDGEFIYTLRHGPLPSSATTVWPPPATNYYSELFIADAVPADGLKLASQTTVEGSPVGMYLVGNRLAVVSQFYPTFSRVDFVGIGAPEIGQVRFLAPDGAGVVDPGDPQVKLTVFDVSDRSAPKVVEETTLDGSYDSSRAVGDRVYVVLRNDTWIPAPEMVDGEGDAGKVYESEASYRARLESTPLADLLPRFAGEAGGDEWAGSLAAAPDVYVKDTDAPTCGQNMLTVAVLNVGDGSAGPSGTTTVAGWAGVTYASPGALYLASTFYDGGTGEDDPPRSGTNLFKFTLAPDAVPLAATGEVEGRVLNQFSMDEHAGHFRIATTVGDAFGLAGTGSSSGVYLFRQDGEDLKAVGSVTNLGQTERIRSARFMGDTAYLVTFRQVDPLFVVDLRDPARPRVAGELKVPGFSTYLHPAGEGLLIGIGRDSDDTGRATGLQLSLFDVSNPAKPKRVAAYKPGEATGYTYSDAEHDHLAFSYFAEERILAIPMFSAAPTPGPAPGGEDGNALAAATPPSPYSLEVFRIDAEDGITSLGRVAEESAVRRSLRIGTTLYVITNDSIRAVQLESPGGVIATLPLPPRDNQGT